MKTKRGVVVVLTFFLVAFISALEAQQELTVTVTQGAGAVNVIRDGSAMTPMIKVEDGNGKPVVGAAVLFEAPESGPSVTFGASDVRATATTDSSGLAQAPTPRPNAIPGEFQIRISASYNGLFKPVTLTQRNVRGQADPPRPNPVQVVRQPVVEPPNQPPVTPPTNAVAPPPPSPFAARIAGHWQFVATKDTRPAKGIHYFEQHIDLVVLETDGVISGAAKVNVSWPGRVGVPKEDKEISFTFLGKVQSDKPGFQWADGDGEVSFEIREDGTLMLHWQRTSQTEYVPTEGGALLSRVTQ